MRSSSPIAGAQYHWSAEHAPRKWRALVSYIQGWVTVTGWVAAIGLYDHPISATLMLTKM